MVAMMVFSALLTTPAGILALSIPKMHIESLTYYWKNFNIGLICNIERRKNGKIKKKYAIIIMNIEELFWRL